MKTFLLLYVISQLISTAYGVCVIEALNPIIKSQLHSKGYTKKNKNSLYEYSDGITNFLKGFIPFYYLIKAVNLIKGDNPIERSVNEKISSGEYITYEEEKFMKENVIKNVSSKENVIEPKIEFEKPEKYTARKIDNTLYDTYITPVDYIINESSKEDAALTPFSDPDRVVEYVTLKEDISNEDIARAIYDLSEEELNALENVIGALKETKKKSTSLYLKDVA